MEIAPIIVHTAVIGIYLNNPPSSEALHVPTLKRTAPIPIKRSPLYNIWAKACATAPFIANSVPIPIATIIKPSWLFRLYVNTLLKSFSITAKNIG